MKTTSFYCIFTRVHSGRMLIAGSVQTTDMLFSSHAVLMQVSGNVKYNSIFYFYFCKLLEKFQVLMYRAITVISLAVLERSLPAMDVVTGKIFINSCHPMINA